MHTFPAALSHQLSARFFDSLRAAIKAAPTRGPAVGRDDCELAGSGGLVWRGVGTPPYGPGRKHAVGAASSRPNRLLIPAAPPPNVVGRHAHMPPWPDRDGCGPGGSGGAVRAAIKAAPTRGPAVGRDDCELAGSGGLVWRGVGTPPYGPGRKHGVGAACMAARTGPRFPPYPRRTPWPGRDDRRPGGGRENSGCLRIAST